MAKKKKKGKKKKEKKEEIEEEVKPKEETTKEETAPPPSIPMTSLNAALSAHKDDAEAMDSAVEGIKETEVDLQGLLSNVASGEGFYRREIKEEKKIKPQLVYNSKEKQVVEDFLMEDVPLTERKLTREEIKQRTHLVDSSLPKKPEMTAPPTPPKKIGIPGAPTSKEIKESAEVEDEGVEDEESASIETEPSFVKKESIYPKLEVFFKDLIEGYNTKYNRWEESISSILSILRQMRKVTKKNTEDLVGSINNAYEKIQKSLDEFVIKRNEVEKIAEVDIDTLSNQFKKVLGMLELQVKEYQFKRLVDEHIHSL